MLKIFKKKCMVALLAAGMLLGASVSAQAIDFKAEGEWLVGFGIGDAGLMNKDGSKHKPDSNDTFGAGQRLRLQLDAVASEALSGTVFFEIGTQQWGSAEDGASLGADGVAVKVKNAYLDWVVPETDLKLRMGLQGFALPNFAGGSAIMDADVAAVVANYQFSDEVGLTAFWMRPVNDNYAGWDDANGNTRDTNYLDNIDLFGLTLPMTFDGIELTPWVAYGIMGKNSLDGNNDNGTPFRVARGGNGGWETADGILNLTMINYHPGFALAPDANGDPNLGTLGKSNAYNSMFFAGLPINVTALDPINIEFDVNYGYVGGVGSYSVLKRGTEVKRADTMRQGWLVKALVEYKMDWGVPGIFGWYASGDDGNVKNGSERMPSIAGAGNFTSFIGDGNLAWGDPLTRGGDFYDWNMSYAGTWGIGLQLRDMSFVEDLSHTFRVAYWGGTNSPSMTKYFDSSEGWNEGYGADGPYLTTNDGLLEFNLVNSYQVYENLEANLELGYIVNMIDKGTWDRSWMGDNPKGWEKKDAWKAQLTFAYTF